MKFPQILLGCSGYRSWRAPFQVCSTAAHLAVPAACAGGHLGLLCSAPSPWPTTAGHIAGASQGFPTAKPLFPARRWERAGEAPVPLGKGSTHHHGPQCLPGLAPCPGGAVLAGTHQDSLLPPHCPGGGFHPHAKGSLLHEQKCLGLGPRVPHSCARHELV